MSETARRNAGRPFEPLRSERGLTLTELAIVGTLAVIVMLGLTGFYFSSQRMWLSGSSQALTQRDASLVIDAISLRAHEAATAIVDTSDPLHHTLTLFDSGNAQHARYVWDSADSLLHYYDDSNSDKGPIVSSKVDRFLLTTVGSHLVEVSLLELRSATGDTVRIASRMALHGK
jgi:hypothetical protein